MLQQFNIDAQEFTIGDFINAEGDKVTLKMTKAEARKFIMEYSDPTLRETFHTGMAFTDDMVKAVLDTLTAQDRTFIKMQMEFYRTYYDRVNAVYREVQGVDLPFNELYSPIRREGVEAPDGLYGAFLDEVSYRRKVSAGSLKDRVKNIRRIAKQSDVNILERHIADMEHYIAWVEKIRDLNAIFKNPNVRAVINAHHSPSMLFTIDRFINDFTRGGIESAQNMKRLDKFRGTYTRSVLAAKASITIKQLTSQVAYAEVMPVVDYAKNTLRFWASPIKNYKFLKKNSVWFKERTGNMERDIKTAMKMKEYSAYRKKQSFLDSLMLNVTIGDQGAIAIGGWAYYTYLVEKKGMSHENAIREFEIFSERTQQSSDLSLLSDWQRGGPLAKILTSFMSAPNLYLRKELGAIRNLLAGRGSKLKHAKTIVIYHFIIPMLFQLTADAFDWDEDNQKRAVVLGPLNGFFALGDGIEKMLSMALGVRAFPTQIAILSVFDDMGKFLNEAFEWIAEGDMTDEDFYRATQGLAGALGAVTGIPMKQAVNQLKTGDDFLDGEYEKALKGLIGYSPYTIEQSVRKKGKLKF